MTHSKELEAVARAIFTAWTMGHTPERWDDFPIERMEVYFNMARAALTAIREPTDGMLDAVYEADVDASGDFEDVFTAAIDYALRDTAGEGE